MPEHGSHSGKQVRHFRQILLWPLQLIPLKEGNQVQRHWEVLHSASADNPWREVIDEFGGAPGHYQERHYNELVTFLPYVQRFLYGDGYSDPRRPRQLADAGISPPRHRRGARCSSPRCAAGDTDHRARRSVLLLRHRRDAAERRGLRRTTCRSTSRKTSCTASAAPIRRDGTQTARAFTRCIRWSGSRLTVPCWRSPIRAIERNS